MVDSNLFAMIFGLFLCSFTVGVSGTCSPPFEENQGKCYAVFESGVTWREAEKLCKTNGAILAEARTEDQQLHLKSLALSNSVNGIWLGGNDIHKEGTWIWQSDGTLITGFSNWYKREPNNFNGIEYVATGVSIGMMPVQKEVVVEGEDCMEMSSNIDFQWTDVPCNDKRATVCQKN